VFHTTANVRWEDCLECRWHQPATIVQEMGVLPKLHDQAVRPVPSVLRARLDSSTQRSIRSLQGNWNTIHGLRGNVVIDHSIPNMVPLAAFYMDSAPDESCGKVRAPAGAGAVQLHGFFFAPAKEATPRRTAADRPSRGPLANGQRHQPLRPRPERSHRSDHPALLP